MVEEGEQTGVDREDSVTAAAWGERDKDARNEGRENEGGEEQLNPHLLIFQKGFFHPIAVGLEGATLAFRSSLRQCRHRI